MFYDVLQALRNAAKPFAAPYTTIEHGALPQENGLAMYPGPGMILEMHLDKGGEYDLFFGFNGKHSQLDVLVHAMGAVHRGLTLMRDYPRGATWQILNIETATPPNYLDREQSGTRQWLYGSLLRVKVYFEGEC